MDLTGLPPTPAAVEQFTLDDTPEAYERLVDRTLASTNFGEHLAVHWLDVARYADTYGYQNDRYREMWPWRDWVIEAFNKNLPYDQFITYQLAGDLLPHATKEQILATAFNRNHRQTNEGGSVEEEFRAEYVADRVNTFGAAFLGLTMECARCHDHKYDPISQQEYYQLAAYFNSIDESGLYSHFTEATPTPTLLLTSDEQDTKIERLEATIAALESKLEDLSINENAFHQWIGAFSDVRPRQVESRGTQSLAAHLDASISQSLIGHFPLDEIEGNKTPDRITTDRMGKVSDNPQVVDGKIGKALKLSGDNAVTVSPGGDFSRNQPFSVSLWVKPAQHYERVVVFHRSRAWTDSASRGYELLIEDGRLSAALIHFWPGNAIRVITEDELPIDRWSHVSMVYDGSSRASGLQLFVDGDSANTNIVRDKLTKHIKGADGFGGGDSKELQLGQRFRDRGFKGGCVDELRVFDSQLTALQARWLFLTDALPINRREFLHNATDELLAAHWLSLQEETGSLKAQLRSKRDELSGLRDPIREIMVMREMASPRQTFVLTRGVYDAPAEQVERGVPESIGPSLPAASQDRLSLAKWLTHPEHPLTSRVAVNRFWQLLFGQGLVRTPEDFGLQGAQPTNPALLDYLAYQFMNSGWDVKQLLKTIVMSQTYRQQSELTPAILAEDPENELLSRGPVQRLSAEMVRDAALFASGQLVEKLGGPPVKPYQPDGLWKEKSGQSYKREPGENSHRRSVYTIWKRTSPPPAMMTFDASNREVCMVQRQVTSTPLQLLVLLNDPQFVEAARALATLAMNHSAAPEEQLEFAFQRLLSRPPKKSELQVLHEMRAEQLQALVEDEADLKAYLEIGDHRAPKDLDQRQLAALCMVIQGLMTHDEFVTNR